MRDEPTAALTVKFQFRMTEWERQMLEELTQKRWPGSEHQVSLMLRSLIWQEYAKWRGTEQRERKSPEEVQ